MENEDFGTVYKTEYENNKGTVSGETAGAGEVVELNYDDKGRLNKMEVFEGGEVALRVEYDFNDKGLCIKSVMKDIVNGGSSTAVYEYNDKGYPTKLSGTYFDAEENKEIKGPDKVLEYDANGRVVRMTYTDYDLDGSYAYGGEALYEYSEAGRLVKLTMIDYSDKDEKSHEEIAEYAEDGSYIVTGIDYKNGKIAMKSVTKYDAKGDVLGATATEYDENGNVTGTYEYDPNKGTTALPEKQPDSDQSVIITPDEDNVENGKGEITGSDDFIGNVDNNTSFDDSISVSPGVSDGGESGSISNNGQGAETMPPAKDTVNSGNSSGIAGSPNPELDTESLVQAINIAELKHPDDYTVSSFRKMTAALDTAKEVLADVNATQDDIDNAADRLATAIVNLEPMSIATDSPLAAYTSN